MNKEVKIGLLFGLAFIIVIGILLSDHLTSTNEPTPATLVFAGNTVRQGVTTPGGSASPVTPVTPPQQVAPQTTVPTAQDLARRDPPVTVVQVGPSSVSPQVTPPPPPAPNTTTTPSVAVTPPTGAQPPVTTVASNSGSTLQDIARTFEVEVVPVGQEIGTPLHPATPPVSTTTTPPAAASAQKTYKAEPGDSLSKMAGKFLGSNTKANRERIIAANPTLKANPDVIVAGRTYVIPPTDGAAAPSSPPAPVTPAPAATQTPVRSAPEHIYTVKSGDTLTRIAVEQLGSADAVASIVELNKGVLKDRNTIHPNMKLRLPAKPIAMAH